MGNKMFYNLYSQIRFTCKLPIIFKWFLHLVLFMQFLIVSLDVTNVRDVLKAETFTPLRHIHFTIIFYPWMYATNSFLFDSCCFLVSDLLFIFELIGLAKKANQGKKIPALALYYVRIIHEFVVPIFCFGLSYRIARQIYVLTSGFDTKVFIALIFYFVDLIMSLFYIYINSIFLEPCDFTIRSNLDIYDGKHTWLVHFAKIVVCSLMYVMDMLDDLPFLLLIVLIITVIVVIYYLRIFNFIHVHFFGQILEITPFAAAPFILLSKRYLTRDLISLLFVEIGLILLFALLIYLNIKILSNHSVDVFRNFTLIVEEKNQIRSLPGNLAAIIRIVAVQSGDPKPIERFIDAQKHISLRTSQIIEIVRFLGIIPDRRKRMIAELEKCQSKSVFHQFIIHYFLLALNSLEKPPDEMYINYARDLYSDYIINYSAFWYYKINKHPFKAFALSTKLIYSFFEAFFGIESLIHRFPYSGDLRLLYSEFLMNACGRVKESFWSRKIAMLLKNEKCYTIDILFKRITKSYPLVRQYTTGVYKNYTDENVRLSDVINLDEYDCKLEEESQTIASHIRQSHIVKPFVTTINLTFATILIFIFTITAMQKSIEQKSLFDQLITNFESLQDLFYNVVSGSLMILSVKYGQGDISQDDPEAYCKRAFNEAPFNSLNYFVRGIPLVNTTNGIFIGSILKYINSIPTPVGMSYCPPYFNITHEYFLNSSLVKVYETFENQDQIINRIKYFVGKYYNVDNYIELSLLFGTVMTISQYLILVLYFYKKMGNIPEDAIGFLISKKRMALLLSLKSIDSWTLLKPYIDASKNGTKMQSLDNPSNEAIDEEEDNIIEQALENYRNSKHGTAMVFGIGSFASWFGICFVLCLIYIPVYFNGMEIFSNLEKIPPLVPVINSLNNIWYLFSQVSNLTNQNIDQWLENLYNNHQVIINSNQKFLEEYQKEICCIRNSDPSKISGYDLIESIINGTFERTNDHFTLVAFPFFIRFSEELFSGELKEFYSSSLTNPASSNESIILLLVVVFALLLSAGIMLDKTAGLAYDSLFHFPYEYFTDTETYRPILNQPIVPGVLTITTIADTDEIYFISDSAEQILGKKPYDFISRRFNETFVPTDNDLRIYTDQDGKTKSFLCQIIRSDVVNKAILVESNQIIGGTSTNEVLTKLSKYIPHEFASLYLETGQKNFEIPHSFLIQFQLDLSHSKIATLCKQATDMPAMYSRCFFVSTYGDRLFMVAGTEDPRVVALILRDVLEGAQKLAVGGSTPLINAIAVNTDVVLEFQTAGFPSLSVDCPSLYGVLGPPAERNSVFIDHQIGDLDFQIADLGGIKFFKYGFEQIRDQFDNVF